MCNVHASNRLIVCLSVYLSVCQEARSWSYSVIYLIYIWFIFDSYLVHIWFAYIFNWFIFQVSILIFSFQVGIIFGIWLIFDYYLLSFVCPNCPYVCPIWLLSVRISLFLFSFTLSESFALNFALRTRRLLFTVI